MNDRSRRISPSRWQLERERFQLPPDVPPTQQEEIESIDRLAPSLLKQFGLESRVWELALLDEWPKLVGETVARRARPGSLEKGTLTVYVSNSVWQQELERYGRDEMLRKLQNRFGADRIKRIRFAPDPDLARGSLR